MVTGWNLLSSAASFPMVLRYSSAVKYQDKGEVRSEFEEDDENGVGVSYEIEDVND
jgi:hypothetical protein